MCTNPDTQASNGQNPAEEQHTENIQLDVKMTNAFATYEKAVNGYQFQVGRYNTWMNYYAIFVGALFVALYSVWPKGEAEALCRVCNPSCGKPAVVAAESQKWILLLIISILGWVASMCWYGALLGYRKWNGHWIGIVQDIEQQCNQDIYRKVYTSMPRRPKRICERIKIFFRFQRDKSKYYVPGFVSTQKVTGIFIFFVIWAWVGVITYILSQRCCGWICWGIAGSVLTVVVMLLLHYVGCCLYSSKIGR